MGTARPARGAPNPLAGPEMIDIGLEVKILRERLQMSAKELAEKSPLPDLWAAAGHSRERELNYQWFRVEWFLGEGRELVQQSTPPQK